jgi:citrate synthase
MSSLSADDAAAYLGVTKETLYAYVSRGLVSSERTGGRARRYPVASLDELKARRAGRDDPAAGTLLWGIQPIESTLTLIEDDRLYYRGHDAVELSRTAALEDAAGLLWAGDLEAGRALFPETSAGRSRTRLASRLVAALVEARDEPAVSLSAPTEATLGAAGALVGRLFEACGARGDGPLARRLARGWRTDEMLVSPALVLCAEHGLNASSFTARVVASTDAPLVNALLAALAALEGRRHGGASRDVRQFLDEVDRIGARRAVDRVISARGWAPGFWGATSLYRGGDPRARELLRLLDLPARDAASRAIAYVGELGGTPTIELALAAFERRHRLPPDAAFVLFALGRSVGWIAHALESAATGRLIRPHARYVGPRPV